MYIAKCSQTFRSGMKELHPHFNMPVTQATLDSAFPESDEDEDFGNTRKKQESTPEKESEENDFMWRVGLALKHRHFKPITKSLVAELQNEAGKVGVSQIETSISDLTPVKDEVQAHDDEEVKCDG